MSDRATPSGRKRPAQKKWPLRRAAKFREETPRKGGGLAIEDRNTALQQYGEKAFAAQAEFLLRSGKSPHKHWLFLTWMPAFAPPSRRLASFAMQNDAENPCSAAFHA